MGLVIKPMVLAGNNNKKAFVGQHKVSIDKLGSESKVLLP